MRYKCKRPDFTQIFIDSVDSLNSPVYFTPPCTVFACVKEVGVVIVVVVVVVQFDLRRHK